MTRRNGVVHDSPAPTASTRVKAEKVKAENARRDKGKQRARDDEEEHEENELEDDAEGEEDNEGEEEGSPRGSKRMRVNGNGNSRPRGSLPDIKRVKTLPRDVDGYIPGSIVRIQLMNFVTYDYVQFSPGPYLNMIVGPNGTGKSSIACAIALGLNFPPSILGRASDLNSFVKIGSDKGYIEIELKGPRGKGNYVIRRNLSAKSKSSTFSLNGEPATGNEIKQKMSELNVQVGNLCSFLPQDKVSEFAAMSPQQLLRETQRAAGDERLTQWHDTLIESGKELKSMEQLIKEDEAQLGQWVERNENIEREVQRFHERKKIEFDIALLEVLIPIEQYRYGLKEYARLRALKKHLHDKANKLKKKNAPAHELNKKLEQQHKKAEIKRDEKLSETRKMFKIMRHKNENSEKLESEWDEINTRLEGLKKQEKERQRKMKSYEVEINKAKEELAKDPPEKLGSHESLAAEARAIQQERNRAVMQRKEELDRKARDLAERRGMSNAKMMQAKEELKKNDDADVQKLHRMLRWDPNTHKGILWLRENQHRFKYPVIEPPFMCINIKDRRYTNAVEACFNPAQLKTFVTQCKADLDELNRCINDEHMLGKGTRITTWFREYSDSSVPPPPMSREELLGIGFDGYALDYVDYPEGLQSFLKKDVQLHRTAVALNGSKVDVNRAMEAVARPMNGFGGGANFINGNTLNGVSRSRYGKKAISNMTRDVPQARNLTVPTIDPELKTRLENTIEEARQEVVGYDAEKEEIEQGREAIDKEEQGFRKRLEDVNRRRDALAEEQRRISSARSKLERNQKLLKDLRSKPKVEDEEKRLKRKLLEVNHERMAISKEYLKIVKEVIASQTEATHLGLKYLQIGANRSALAELCKRKDEKFQKALMEFTKADEEFKKVKEESMILLQENKERLRALPADISDAYRTIEKNRTQYDSAVKEAETAGRPKPSAEGVDLRTVEQLENELETQKAKLDMSFRAQPGVVEEYEKRKRDIEQLQQTIENRKKNAEKVENGIRKAKENWQPALEKLVASIGEKFSAAFDRIGCAGEIRISQHEDYDKWAIDILVKFRDSEKLQLLTGQRQSGGERSLTTILYLMSLTEEARAPFSLVDEINQGMDQRAERNVHNSLVEVTCKEESAQYFLITPKLLPDLNYHERMKVLCVNNGEWLPEERNLGNMMNMINTYLQHNGGGNN